MIDFAIYSSTTGDCTGAGTMTEDELDNFLAHYNAKRFNETAV